MRTIRVILLLASVLLLGCIAADARIISTDEQLESLFNQTSIKEDIELIPGRVYDMKDAESWCSPNIATGHTFNGKGAVIILPYDSILFGTNYGTILNIRVQVPDDIEASENTGIICRMNTGTISGCTVFSEADCTVFLSAGTYLGGIAGTNPGTISDCQVLDIQIGNKDMSADAGGIAGYSMGTIRKCRVKNIKVYADRPKTDSGGIAGANAVDGHISFCEVYCSDIEGDYAGGIAGCNVINSGEYHEPTIECCRVNSGRIGGRTAGGITGWNNSGHIIRGYVSDNLIQGNHTTGGVAGSNETAKVGSCKIEDVWYDNEISFLAVGSGTAADSAYGRDRDFFFDESCISAMKASDYLEMGDEFPLFLNERLITSEQNTYYARLTAAAPDGTVLHPDTFCYTTDIDYITLVFSTGSSACSSASGTPITDGRYSFSVTRYYVDFKQVPAGSKVYFSDYYSSLWLSCDIINNYQQQLAEEIARHRKNYNSLTPSLYPEADLKAYKSWIDASESNNSIHTALDGLNWYSKNMNDHAIWAPEGVALNKNTASLSKGQTLQLKAVITPDKAACKDVYWYSNNKSVATVDDKGLVTAVAPGTAVIAVETAEGGYDDSCEITVTDKVLPDSIELNRTKILYLKEGKTYTFVPTLHPDNTTNKSVKWGMGNSALCSLYKTSDTKAIVYGKSQGKTQIGVRSLADESLLAKCGIQVYKPISKAEISATAVTLTVGKTKTLTAKISPADATYKDKIKWGSTKSKIASVDANGKITAKSKGTCTIGFKTSEGGFKATCKVTVK